jgi:hypothetical protein
MMTDGVDTLKQIAEDAFLLAAGIRDGDDQLIGDIDTTGADDREAMREWRIIELIVGVGERICSTAGLGAGQVWIPDVIQDMTPDLLAEEG